MNPLDAEEYRRWIAQAHSALSSADTLATEQPGWACFLYEQAAQMAVKGLLHAIGADAWGHDLVALEARLVVPLADAWPGLSAPATRLARHYIPTRYPDAQPGGVPAERYGPDDAASGRADAEVLLGAVERAWSLLQTDVEGGVGST